MLHQALLVWPSKHPVPIHWDIFSNPDWSVNDGQFVYPAIFLAMWLGAKANSHAANSLKNGILIVTSFMLATLQVQASFIAFEGPAAFVLPRWVVPAYLAALSAVIIYSTLNLTVFRPSTAAAAPTEQAAASTAEAPRSPRSPRSLIKSLASPELVDEDNEGDSSEEKESTPVKPVRSPRGRASSRAAAKSSPSSKSPVRRSPRRRAASRSPRRTR